MFNLIIELTCLAIAIFLAYLMYTGKSLITKNNNIYVSEEKVNKEEKNVMRTVSLSLIIVLIILLIISLISSASNINVNQTSNQTVIVGENQEMISDPKIDINKASKEELMSLKGIGEKKADEIIKYRNEKTFENVSELLNIIGQTTYDEIKDNVKVGG